jgi:hypothetical protein
MTADSFDRSTAFLNFAGITPVDPNRSSGFGHGHGQLPANAPRPAGQQYSFAPE